MNTTLIDSYNKHIKDTTVVVPINLIKSTFGINDEFVNVEFDENKNAIILSSKIEGN